MSSVYFFLSLIAAFKMNKYWPWSKRKQSDQVIKCFDQICLFFQSVPIWKDSVSSPADLGQVQGSTASNRWTESQTVATLSSRVYRGVKCMTFLTPCHGDRCKEENILGGFRGLLRERLKIQTNQSQIWNIHWISDTMVYFFYVDLLSGSDSCCLQLQFGII